MSVIIDDTPEHIKKYWIEQNPSYVLATIDPAYIRERELASTRRDPLEDFSWRYRLNQLDPSHPKAPVPEWVRFAKRQKQQFRCAILGWQENDWMINKMSGIIQPVGVLTVDHVVPAAEGGLTTDANTLMVAEIANNKKGCKLKSYEQMREHLHSVYDLYEPTIEELLAFKSLRQKNITKVKL